MLFNSLQFFFFFIIIYGVYLLLTHKWQNRLLIVASCLFYATWNWKFLGLMFVSISTDYFCSRYMAQTDHAGQKRRLLLLSVSVNLVILGVFKYYNFFVDNLQALLGLIFPFSIPSLTLRIILPLGISFYTFEAISYVVDVYKGTIKPAEKYWDYLLFVIYFPHLVAGPIMRAKQFLPQITSARNITGPKVYQGMYLFFLGLFQKVFVADNMAKIVNPLFNHGSSINGADVLVGSYAFTFQIFGDFAGYSNMARGLGQMMGFDISVNFNTPFFSTNAQEFWNRWHITLSQWVRDYLYIPMVGHFHRIKGNARIYLALLLSMTLMGLWHGAAWHFVLFGVYSGILLMLYVVIRTRWATVVVPKSVWGERFWFLFRVVFIFHLTVLGMMIFRCRSIFQLGTLLSNIFLNFNLPAMDINNLMSFIALALPLMLLQIMEFTTKDIFFILKRHWLITNGVLAFMTYLLIGWGAMRAEQFIYFQF